MEINGRYSCSCKECNNNENGNCYQHHLEEFKFCDYRNEPDLRAAYDKGYQDGYNDAY